MSSPLMSWREADILDYWKERFFLNKEIQKRGKNDIWKYTFAQLE